MNIIRKLLMLVNREIPTDILVKRGMKCGDNFSREQGCFIDPTHCWLISIGSNVTFSIRVTVLAHDASMKQSTGYARIGKVTIGDNVFVGANATILPGVSIGSNVIVAANSVVTKDIQENCIVAGVPARPIAGFKEWKKRIEREISNSEIFTEEYTMRNKHLSDAQKEEMIRRMENNSAYIE